MNASSSDTGQQGDGAEVPDSGHNNAPLNKGKKSFASLFKDNRVPDESSLLHYIDQPAGDIKLELDEIESVESTHGFCLVGYVYGSRPSPYAFVNFLKGWGSNIKLFFKENGWIKFQFPTAGDRKRVLSGGPYMILGRHLFLKALPSCFLYSKDEMMLLPSWVQILGLLAECWTTKALSKIASMVGKPIHTDKMTISKKGSNYARVLVELDAKQPRVWEQVVVLLNGTSISVQFKYELDPKFCGKCNSLGHHSEMCGVKVHRKVYNRKAPAKTSETEPINENDKASHDVNPAGHDHQFSEILAVDVHTEHNVDQPLAETEPETALHSGIHAPMVDELNLDNHAHTSTNRQHAHTAPIMDVKGRQETDVNLEDHAIKSTPISPLVQQSPLMILMNKVNKLTSSQVPQTNTHLYFEDDASVNTHNSEPYESLSDLDDLRTVGVNDALYYGDLQHNEEWITVKCKHLHNKRGKAKAVFFESSPPAFRQPLTRSQSLLLQKSSNMVRLPKTALLDV